MSPFSHSVKLETVRISVFLSCVGILPVLTPDAYPTAIVAARSPEFIVIGADSKAIRGGNKTDTIPVCKIKQVGKYYYAAAGLTNNPHVNYSLQSIVEEAFRGDETLSQMVGRFDRLVQAPLSNALEYVKRDNPIFYKHTFDRGDRVALEILFAGDVDGELFLTSRAFIIERQSPPISVRATHHRSCPGTCSTGTVVYYMGSDAAMADYSKRNPQVWHAGAVPAIKELLQVQASSTPEEVGGPTDILFLSKDATKWVESKAECR